MEFSAAEERKRHVDMVLVLFVPAMLLVNFIVRLTGVTNLVALYGLNALLVEGLVIFLPAWLLMQRNGGPAAFGFKRISGRELFFSLLLGVGVFFFVTTVNALMTIVWALFGLTNQGTAVPSQTPLETLASLLFVAIIPAVAEETLFRGALLRSWLPFGAKRAIFHTALLFALAHMQLLSVPALFVAGLIFSYVSYITGSVYSAMAMHLSYNASVVCISALARGYLASGAQDAAGLEAVADMLEEYSFTMPELNAFAVAILVISVIIALGFYAGVGFGIGYPSYRALLRASARRLDIPEYGVRLKEVKAALAAAAEGKLQSAPLSEAEDLREPRDQSGLGWRAWLSYLLLLGLAALMFLLPKAVGGK